MRWCVEHFVALMRFVPTLRLRTVFSHRSNLRSSIHYLRVLHAAIPILFIMFHLRGWILQCNVNNSTKKNRMDRIGEHGIGFKSVFKVRK